jgi:hypothetical protein
MCASIFKCSPQRATEAATILAFTPAQALACPVCALVGSGDNAWAYTAMSVMLIMLPLGMIGGAVLWLSRRATTGAKGASSAMGATSATTPFAPIAPPHSLHSIAPLAPFAPLPSPDTRKRA